MIPAWVACIESVGECVRSPRSPERLALRSSSLARPKSRTFTVPSGRILILAGLRSRWMMPCSCAASSASAICFAIGSASSSGIAPRALGQILALDEFHHQCVHARRFLKPVDRGDLRMIQ